MGKVLCVDALRLDSTIQVGSHKYARLFNQAGYDTFSISHNAHIFQIIKRSPDNIELINSCRGGVKRSEEGILYYTPFTIFPYTNLPILNTKLCVRNALKSCIPSLKSILRNHGFNAVDFIFINNVHLYSIINIVKYRKLVYRISDRIEGFPNMPRTIKDTQREVIKRADIVFATTLDLVSMAKSYNTNVFHLPNGVDSNFIMSKDVIYETPQEFSNIISPIVIYVGAIGDWFDFNAYEFTLDNLKDISFVMIGQLHSKIIMKKIEKLQSRYVNFFYLGPKQHKDIQNFLIHSDVAIIPFVVNDFTDNINPVKLFEYVACGLPVIASKTKELNNYLEVVNLYTNKEEFVMLIKNLINNPPDKNILINFAKENTWEKRFQIIKEKIL